MIVWVLLVALLSDTGLEKRIRSAVVTVALVASVMSGDKLQMLSLLQLAI